MDLRVVAGSLLDVELKLEQLALDKGAEVYRKMATTAVDAGRGGSLKPAQGYLSHWFPILVQTIKAEQRAIEKGESGGVGRSIYGPVLASIPANVAAGVVISTAMSMLMRRPGGVPRTQLMYALARDTVAEHHLIRLNDEYPDALSKLRTQCKLRHERVDARKINWLAGKQPDTVKARQLSLHLGGFLLWSLIESASTNDHDKDFRLAFHVERRLIVRGGRRLRPSFVALDDVVYDHIQRGHEMRQYLRPKYLPMVIPPLSWGDKGQEGPYVKNKPAVVSRITKGQKAAIQSADVSRMMHGLDIVNGQAYQVDPWLSGLALDIWNDGGGQLEIPPADDPEIPEKLDASEHDEESIAANRRAIGKALSLQRRLRGDRQSFIELRDIVLMMRPHDRIFIPHRLCFRGRCYAMAQHLNPQAWDLPRAMLRWSEGRHATSPSAWLWRLRHAANCWGIDKVPFEVREEWAESMIPQMRRAVADPRADQWWRGADKPWQFLAAARAVVDDGYAAQAVAAIDGANNGLQHYAAMTRDPELAEAVNLAPSEIPQSMYARVTTATVDELRRRSRNAGAPPVNMDEAKILRDRAKAGDEDARRQLDGLARLCVEACAKDPKLLKQPTMTTVYDVTMVGAKSQIRRRMRTKVGMSLDNAAMCSLYLTEIVMPIIRERSGRAGETMDWLKDGARTVGRDGRDVAWYAPIGFPVIQDARRHHYIPKNIRERIKMRVCTRLGETEFIDPSVELPVSVKKQVSGISPNFVHSVDMSHMFLVMEAAEANKIHVRPIHDSFGSHFADMDMLQGITLERLVALHTEDILGNMHAQLQSQTTTEIPSPPARGDFDLNEILRSKYAFA